MTCEKGKVKHFVKDTLPGNKIIFWDTNFVIDALFPPDIIGNEGLFADRIDTVTIEDIHRFLVYLKDKPMSGSSIVNYVYILRAYYNWAAYTKQNEKLSDVLLYLRNVVKIRKQPRFPYVPSPEDVIKLRNTLKSYTSVMSGDKNSQMYRKAITAYAIIELLITTGMRSKELRGLMVSDIDFEKRTIYIGNGKGDTQRYSLFGESAIAVLKEFILVHSLSMDSKLFAVKQANSLNYILKRWAKRAGVATKLHAHSFRHFFITEAQRRGIPAEIVARQVGHKNLNTTNHYTHFDTETLRDRLSALQI